MAEFTPIVAALGSLNAVTSTFKPRHNLGFNVSISDTFSGTIALQRQFVSDFVTPSAATVAAAGTVYIPAQTITLGVAPATVTVLTVATTQVVSATINVAGSGYTNGAQTFTVNTGTGTQATVSITVSGGTPSGAVTVLTGGSYTANPTLSGSATTGPAGTGLTLNLVMGVNTVTVTSPGVYQTTPTNPVAQTSTSGSGTGATFNLVTAAVWRTVSTWTAPTESQVTEVENGTVYRLAMTVYSSGSAAVRLGQQK